ncbi:MAG: DUF3857 and transglutaminase domain-containing protein [Acidobacteriota bacterium]
MRRLITAAAAAIISLAAAARADTAPTWVMAALKTPAVDYDNSAPYVVLMDERVTTVRDSGRAETRWRSVVRILTQEGRAAARREIYYDSQIHISDLRAWHIRSDQRVFELERDKVTEQSRYDDLYSDIKSKVMRLGEVEVGSVVAFEWTQKEKPLVNQDYHFFQSRAPVVISRYQINVPADWRVESIVFNHPPIDPKVENSSYTWQIENLSPIKEEPWMEDAAALAPYLAVSYYPARGEAARRSVSSWQEVSRWAYQFMRREPRAKTIIEAKAKEMAANSNSEIEKVRSLARWVQQKVRYVSIQLSAVGGYRPNPAEVVLRNGAGDCKDKAALLQAMLRSVGVESHIVLVYAGDASRVRAEFPSPLQFNHAIIAVAINSNLPSSVDDARLGRLLFFDPTDDTTPLGQLPFYLQGSLGLVVKNDGGDLIRLPAQSEESNALRREIDIEAGAAGEITARVAEVYSGQMAALARRRIQSSSAEDYVREMGSRISRDIPGAVISELKISGQAELDEPLRIEYEIRAAGYANRMSRLMVIRSLPLRAGQFPAFTRTERLSPVRFDMKSIQEDIVRINLPHGFRIDELPKGAVLASGFGEFKLDHQLQDRRVVVHRRLAIKAQSVSASEYGEVKRFFDAAQSASQSNIVLVSE